MSGVAVIRYLLANNAPLVAAVPAVRIMAGEVPLNTPLPAISVSQVSSVPFNTVAMNEPKRQHTDRVQVTALVKASAASPGGAGYPGVKALMLLVLAACPHTRGNVNGFDVDSVIPDVEGPDLSNEQTGLLAASRDFIVKWNH